MFEAPDFSFGTSEAAEQFVEIAYEDGWVLPEFDRMEWLGTDHHQCFEQDHEGRCGACRAGATCW